MLNHMGLPGLLFIVVWIVNIWALWKLLARSGSPGWLALFGLFPVLFFGLLWYAAFKRWPDHK
ncbi:hypothetical protein [uncultured Jannaschia sp.]|uniref:hypothetical protein n=1 Tax=uncultured Jannaschia sp. TaxID=293347 RepID=UPI002610CCF8|nr:hypothetical protein [uncultured Jannaschia sp.]